MQPRRPADRAMRAHRGDHRTATQKGKDGITVELRNYDNYDNYDNYGDQLRTNYGDTPVITQPFSFHLDTPPIILRLRSALARRVDAAEAAIAR
jgi:hypothetical protein